MSKRTIEIYDTTLRDGTQGEGVNYTVRDKIAVAQRLDEFGVSVIEGGWPGSNPRDEEFFRAAKTLRLRHARIAAFGSTKRPGARAADDRNLQQCVTADTPVITIVGMGMRTHAGVAARMFDVLSREGVNIQMISTSEIKISVVIDAKYVELAQRALHDAFVAA